VITLISTQDAEDILGVAHGALGSYAHRLRHVAVRFFKHGHTVAWGWPEDIIKEAAAMRKENRRLGVAAAIEAIGRRRHVTGRKTSNNSQAIVRPRV